MHITTGIVDNDQEYCEVAVCLDTLQKLTNDCVEF